MTPINAIHRACCAALLLLGLHAGAGAQEADHPSGAPMVVGSDFGVAPWMVRSAIRNLGAGSAQDVRVSRR